MANEIGSWGSPSGNGFAVFSGDSQANVGGASVFTPAADSTLIRVRVFGHIGSGAGTAVIALYTVVAGLPVTKVAELATITFAGFSDVMYESGPLGQLLTAGTSYCLAIGKVSGGTLSLAQTAQTNGASFDNDGGVHDLESPWTHRGYINNLIALAGDVSSVVARAYGAVASWFSTAGGPTFTSQTGDTTFLATAEYGGADLLAALGGVWTDLTPDATHQLRVFATQSVVTMPSSINWGSQFQAAMAWAYKGLSLNVSAVSAIGNSTSASTFVGRSLTITDDSTVVIYVGMFNKDAGSDGATLATVNGLTPNFTIRGSQFPNGNSKLGFVVADSLQGAATSIASGAVFPSIPNTTASKTQALLIAMKPSVVASIFTPRRGLLGVG